MDGPGGASLFCVFFMSFLHEFIRSVVSTLKVPNIQQKYIFSSHVCIKFRNGECLGENGGESPNDCRSKGHIGYHVKTVHPPSALS